MMANNDQIDQAAKESLMTSLIAALKENRAALPFLPAMMEQLIEMQQQIEEKTKAGHSLHESR